jgi:uncharacterized protein (UPF0262 family)
MSEAAQARLARIVLDEDGLTRMAPYQETDRAQAVADLCAENFFAPVGLQGPFVLHLSIQDGRLIFDIRDTADRPLATYGLALGPFRKLVKDYQLLVDSHAMAVQEGREARIQAIDMGRRGLHNEGAALMVQRLQGKVAIDLPTARRLFTLVCALYRRG